MTTTLASDVKKRSTGSQEEFLKEGLFQRELAQGELVARIKSSFPKLDSPDISSAAEQLAEFDNSELEILLHPGSQITRKGKRVQAAYIKTAPLVYQLTKSHKAIKTTNKTKDQISGHTEDRDFLKWLSLAGKASELSFSCLEGFFDASLPIIRKKGLPLLEKWTEIGGLISEKNNTLAIAYFTHTANAFASTNLEDFKVLTGIGEKYASSNLRVAEAYFEHLDDLLSLLSPGNFQLFCSIIERLLGVQWTTAVEILSGTKEVFSAIPPQRQKELLDSLNEFLDFEATSEMAAASPANDKQLTDGMAASALSLFKNAAQAMERLNDRDFETWVSTAKKIAKTSVDASVTFMDRSPGILLYLETSELEQWSDRATSDLASDRQAFERFYQNSFRSLEKHLKDTSREERGYLLDMGVGLALIDPCCLENYFEFAPAALRLLSEPEFKDWVDTGARISKESPNLGTAYFKNSVIALRKVRLTYRGELFRIAASLLEKDWLLAGKFFENLPEVVEKIEQVDIRKWAGTGAKVHDTDRKLAVDYFTYSPKLLGDLDLAELEEWALKGLRIFDENAFLGRPYFSLRSRGSKDFIDELAGAAALKKVANILRYYAMGLSGTSFKIRSKKELPTYNENDPVNPVISGRTIYLEPKIKKYGKFEDNFKIYKLSVMHEVGHSQFSSSKIPSEAACELLKAVNEKYGTRGDERAERAERAENDCQLSEDAIDISSVISLFPNRVLAASILGVLEDARVEYLIMDLYRGVRFDLETIRHQMLLSRTVPEGNLEKLMEALLWISTLHEPPFELPSFELTPFGLAEEEKEEGRSFLDKTRDLLQHQVLRPDSSTLTSLEATFAIYGMFESLLGPLEERECEMLKNIEYRGMGYGSFGVNESPGTKSHENVIKKFIPEIEDKPAAEKEKPEEKTKEKKAEEEKTKEEREKPRLEYALEKNWRVLGSYSYDEWDYLINDYKSDWCLVHEIEPAGGSNEYYRDASERYKNEIALIKNIFSRMKPESFHKMKGQTDGTEIDIDAFSDALIERRCGVNPDEKFYVRWDKRKRDVATLFLVDVSASTKKRLGPERRSIMDVEKDALIIMIQALESIGDKYAIYAFSGHKREGVEYYLIKEFGEELSGTVEQRISLLEPAANTRLGPAIRHSVKKLDQVKARTKILVLLSDGEPYDTCHGEGVYQGKLAEEDTKVAIQEGNAEGIHFFCITVDTNPGDYLENIFSDSGYTIIDDAQILPERLPLLYKRITT